MSDYPEALVGRVADVIVEFAPDNPPGVQQMWSYEIGERILDALGLREEWDKPTPGRIERRYVTDWEEA